jgi:hypothetical protein
MMSILNVFPVSSMIGAPFCDYLNVTTPKENDAALRDRLEPLFDETGLCSKVDEYTYQFLKAGLNGGGFQKAGVAKIGPRGKVTTLSLSGSLLRLLRARRLFDEVLSVISEFPHRVTRLDATADYVVADRSAVIHEVRRAGHAGQLSLTRKSIPPGQIKSHLSLGLDGRESGTLYLGQSANADVSATVYDKTKQMWDVFGAKVDSIVRVELLVSSGVGPTLRDVADPTNLFFHFASRSLVEAPPGHMPWVGHSGGFVLPPSVPRLPLQRIEALVQRSPDVQRLIALVGAAYTDKKVATAVLARLFASAVVPLPV